MTLIPNPYFHSHSQANLEEDKQEKNQDALEKLGHESGKLEVEKSDSEASDQEEHEEDKHTDKCSREAKVRPWSFNVHVLLSSRVRVLPLCTCLVSSYRNRSWSP